MPARHDRESDAALAESGRRPGKVSGTYVSLGRLERRSLVYETVGELGVVEGDIVLGRAANLEAMRREVESAGPRDLHTKGIVFWSADRAGRWPGGRIPFVVDPALAHPERVTEAIKHWETRTPIRFVARGTQDDFVTFTGTGTEGCASWVGRHGGEQHVYLGNACGTGNAIHEIGHAVGLWHEQSRSNRDEFIAIDWSNIVEDAAFNFDQHVSDGEDVGPYDWLDHALCTTRIRAGSQRGDDNAPQAILRLVGQTDSERRRCRCRP